LIYLVRHGQTVSNSERRLQGQADSPLTEQGVEQARRVGLQLKALVEDPGIWQIIASPLGRTVHTANIIREAIGLKGEIALEPRIMEVNVGEWEGLNREQIEAISPGITIGHDWLARTPGGERYEDISARLGAFLAEIDETDGRSRIVVSHGIAGRVMRGLYLKWSLDEIWSHDPPPQDAIFHFQGGTIRRIDRREEVA
jgi:probable phosphoglycerate mutase